jgi:hypothetical protein
MDDSTYIGKATFKRNQFTRTSNIFGGPEQTAHMKSLRRNNEMEKMGADLDRMLNEKKEALRRCKMFVLKRLTTYKAGKVLATVTNSALHAVFLFTFS